LTLILRANRLGMAYSCLAQANLPVMGGLVLRAMVFGRTGGPEEVMALVHRRAGAIADSALVRLHSACLTGDTLGSERCDCGPQLRLALDVISRADWGVVLYLLRQEGRGIGLLNKMRAYALQDGGLDTVEANTALGFPPDLRDFAAAAEVLLLLGVNRVRLLTNNPAKARALELGGVQVVERVPMDIPATTHSRRYLETKQRYFGHLPVRDPGTGLYTLDALERMLKVARDGREFPVLLVRLDGFAGLRELLGEEAAQKLLGRAVEALKAAARGGDLLARASDAEFLVVGERPDDARLTQRRIHAALVRLTREQLGAIAPLRHSIGVATIPGGSSVEALLALGRQALRPSRATRVRP
jgi:GTP cyclohydrolase II